MPDNRQPQTSWLQTALNLLGRREPFMTALVAGPEQHPRVGQRALIRRGRDGSWEWLGALSDARNELLSHAAAAWAAREARTVLVNLPPHAAAQVPSPSAQVFLAFCGPPETAWVFGAGHIAQALSPMLISLGWHVIICDDRDDYVTAERFPDVDERKVGDFPGLASDCASTEGSWAVLVTRGHQHDEQVLRELAANPPRYVGMIGSSRRVAMVRQRLENEGVASSFLDAIHAPIGLPIGADSPAEIAVAIAAELVAVRRGADPRRPGPPASARSVADTSGLLELWKRVDAARAGHRPAVLATITARQGSTPRGLGAQMAIFADGSIAGTIGGGCGEDAIRHAAMKMLLAEGAPRLIEVDLTGDPAAEAADVCGGRYSVFLEFVD